jgi:hypothetical protein
MRRPSKKNHNKHACKRTATVGTLSLTGHAGLNQVSFQGRISSRKLKPGRYTLVVVASASGQSSNPARLNFTIVKK